MAVHRVIEAQAVVHPQAVALRDDGIAVTFRELNQRANLVARYLTTQGFRRGSLAKVRLAPSAETAIVLLGILKTGGMYGLLDSEEDSAWPAGVSFEDESSGDLRLAIDDSIPWSCDASPSCANLPVVTRPTDIACVLMDRHGTPLVSVPHASITSLLGPWVVRQTAWTPRSGALDMWIALMTGATVTVHDRTLTKAA